ncbi:unnamed protein product [Heligmosomoides polygyrus]|uniref:ACT domain-containing protein n=1 Tax=Heligmosomoides polygyrus TaxID=6339 RepID=A0A183FR25_HELPZ|nr:unnamed protein product [Heligmosomoides polygyrus]
MVYSIDGVVAVREGGIALGILKMFEEEKTVLEGAGAIGPAAILQRSVRGLEGRRIACILTGGNIDITALGRAIEKGLALDVRLTQVKTIIDDKPGAFAEYFGVFRDNESNLVDAVTETIFHRLDAQTGRCKVIADIAGEDHMIQVNEAVVAK